MCFCFVILSIPVFNNGKCIIFYLYLSIIYNKIALNIGIFSIIPLLRSIRRNLSSVKEIRNAAVEMYNLSFNDITDENDEIKNRLSNSIVYLYYNNYYK